MRKVAETTRTFSQCHWIKQRHKVQPHKLPLGWINPSADTMSMENWTLIGFHWCSWRSIVLTPSGCSYWQFSHESSWDVDALSYTIRACVSSLMYLSDSVCLLTLWLPQLERKIWPYFRLAWLSLSYFVILFTCPSSVNYLSIGHVG